LPSSSPVSPHSPSPSPDPSEDARHHCICTRASHNLQPDAERRSAIA
jgi:hypothetical protein